MHLPSSHYLVGSLAHAAAAAILLVILLLGSLRLEAADQVTRGTRECDCIGTGFLCLFLAMCEDVDK